MHSAAVPPTLPPQSQGCCQHPLQTQAAVCCATNPGVRKRLRSLPRSHPWIIPCCPFFSDPSSPGSMAASAPPGPWLGSYVLCQDHQSLSSSDSAASALNPSQQQAWDIFMASFVRVFFTRQCLKRVQLSVWCVFSRTPVRGQSQC